MGISVAELTKRYGSGFYLKPLSFEVVPGTVAVLVGPNGSGKTTTIECMLGLRLPDGGTVSVHGLKLKDGLRFKAQIGVQLQDSAMPGQLRVGEALDWTATVANRGQTDIDATIEQLGFSKFLGKAMEKLSGGQRRRVMIGLALLTRGSALILDEPHSGMDPRWRADVWEVIRDIAREGVAVLVSTHDLLEAERHADQVVMLDKGTLIGNGSVRECKALFGLTHALELDDLVDATSCSLPVLIQGRRALLMGTAEQVEEARVDLGIEHPVRPATLEEVFLLVTQPKPDGGNGDD